MGITLNIGGKKEPTKSLADELKGTKPLEGDLNPNVAISDKKILITNPINSPLAAMLKPTTEMAATSVKKEVVAANTIPAVTGEKYALIAEASDTLSQETINQFNQRMRMIELTMNNSDLHNAMDRVIVYCQEHNELRPFLRAEIIDMFVKGARNSYAQVSATKTTNRGKRSKASKIDDTIMAELADIVIEL